MVHDRVEGEGHSYEGEEVEAPADEDLENELPDVPGVTPADDPREEGG